MQSEEEQNFCNLVGEDWKTIQKDLGGKESYTLPSGCTSRTTFKNWDPKWGTEISVNPSILEQVKDVLKWYSNTENQWNELNGYLQGFGYFTSLFW